MTAFQNSLAGLTHPQLQDALRRLNVPERQIKMRANQLWRWIYAHGVNSFEQMSDVSKDMRAQLEAHHSLTRPQIITTQISVDGTRKWVLSLKGETDLRPHLVEMVYIPEAERGTLCVSSQVGCTLACTFCHTGTQKLVRNLTSAEIIAQLMIARDELHDWPNMSPETGAILPMNGSRFITNIVFMGMGEPLYNLDNVAEAIDTISDGDGIAIGRRRITVSTAGVAPKIAELGTRTNAMLAISLHATNDDLRNELVPINRKYNLAELMGAISAYPSLGNSRKVTFEYVMLKGVNDTVAEAHDLVRLLKGLPAKINLIPFNPWPGSPYECSSWETIEAFAEILNRAGYASPIRTPRGRDILAACGQLRSESVKKSAAEKRREALASGEAGA